MSQRRGIEKTPATRCLTLMNPHMIATLAVDLEVLVAKVTLKLGRYVDVLPNHVTLERFQRLEDLATVPTHHLAVFVRPFLVQLHGRFTLERTVANFTDKRPHRCVHLHVGLQQALRRPERATSATNDLSLLVDVAIVTYQVVVFLEFEFANFAGMAGDEEWEIFGQERVRLMLEFWLKR
jgi:hypothetical protein